jgi:Uncharacterized conserved protein
MSFVRASLGLAALALSTPGLVQAQKQFTLSGSEVAIYNLVGTVSVTAGRGDAVTVAVTPRGADADKLTFGEGTVRGRNALRVIYPADRIIYSGMGRGSSTELSVRSDGTFGGDEEDRHGNRGGRVRITGSGSGLEAYADLVISVPEGKSVNVYLGVGDITASNVKGDLRLDTSSGRVDVTGTKGDLSVDTGSGDVKVTGASGSQISIDTGSGEVNGTELKATSLDVDTGSGDVELSDVMAEDVTIDTGSGSVNLALKTTVDHLKVDTGSGNVTIAVPGTLSAQVAIETGSGDITTDFPIQVRKTGGDELIGTIGSGTGHIDIDTGSGDVKLLKRP